MTWPARLICTTKDANSVDSDLMPRFAAPDLDVHYTVEPQ